MASAAKVRVRFAPSPTGQLHVGNARTALFNWLFARQKGGTMVLRIEDTDVERSEARFETQLLDDLKWLGLDWDEGPDAGGSFAPYRQSDRVAIYREHAERLLREGKAYLCFCTPEELEQERQRAQAEHRSPIYSGKCRKLDPAEAERRRAAGEPAAIRLHIPEHPLRFHDMVHGAVEFPNEVISDPIILRSNGMPVYNFVVVIDDALMKITHVIRGDDHLSNTPKQVALYEALGWPTPEFAHLSTILGSDRERLSKRHGATSVANFREMGVLPEALVNYLALLGWAPSGGDREIFSREELIREFSLDRVTPSPAVFDMEKLYWLNRHYIKQRFGIEASAVVDVGTASPERLQVLTGLSSTELAKIRHLGDLVAKSPTAYSALLAGRFFEKAGFGDLETFIKDVRTERWFLDLVRLLAPSVNQLSELPSRAWLIFSYDSDSALQDPSNAQVLQNPKTAAVIQAFAKHMGKQKRVTPEDFKAVMTQVKTETGAKGQELFHPVRIMLTGSHSGPEFDKLIPIIEEGSQLNLPKHVKSVWERVEEFTKSRNASSA